MRVRLGLGLGSGQSKHPMITPQPSHAYNSGAAGIA